jgi:alkaline phosphatase
MKKRNKKLAGLSLAVVLSTSIVTYSMVNAASDNTNHQSQPTNGAAKNVILLIGDGMAGNQISAAAYFKGGGYGADDLAMDQFTNVGYARTFSHDNTVTDSAAAATAFSSTYKTDNGVVGKAPKNKEHHENEEHFDVETVLEAAEQSGMSTGLVSTARITHATPAAFASHIDDRDKENNIAEQMILEHDIEVLLGGGKHQFLPKGEGGKREDGKNLLDAAKEKGYQLIENKDEMEKADSDKLLGLFNNSHMTYELDRDLTDEPSIDEMTNKALDVLQHDDDGFFLMVEGGRIDHAGHANYPATNIQETLAFDKAVKEAVEFAKKDKNTLVIVSADHETGGMSIGVNGEYGFNKDVIRNVKRTPEYISQQLNKHDADFADVMATYAGIHNLTEEEIDLIQSTTNKASAIAKIISDRALIGWTTTGHTAVNVPVYAYGPLAEKLTGTIDNTEIAEVISLSTTKSFTSQNLIDQVNELAANGEITDKKAARTLLTHLKTVRQFEEKEAIDKVVKQLTNFHLLLDKQKEKEVISTNAYQTLKNGADALLAKWQ